MQHTILVESSSFDELRGTIDGRRAYSLAGEPFWFVGTDQDVAVICRCGADAFRLTLSDDCFTVTCAACGKGGRIEP